MIPATVVVVATVTVSATAAPVYIAPAPVEYPGYRDVRCPVCGKRLMDIPKRFTYTVRARNSVGDSAGGLLLRCHGNKCKALVEVFYHA